MANRNLSLVILLGGLSVNLNHLKTKTFKQNWILLISFRIIEFLVIWDGPTLWPTHPPTHPSIGGCVSTNHKSSNRIQLSQWNDDLLDF